MLFPRTLYRADPFALVRRLSEDFDRLAGAGAQAFPPVNVWQNEEAAAITAELPGVDPTDIDISVKDQYLTLTGERKPPQLPDGASWHRQERTFGRFTRVVRLPFRVDPDRVQAHFIDGVLRIAVGRPEQDKPRRIEINAA